MKIFIICSKYMASSNWVCVSMQVVTVVTRKNPPIRYTGGHMTMSLTLLTWLPAWLLDIAKTRLYVFKRPVHDNNHGDWVTKSSEESYTRKIVESAVLSVLQPGEEYEWRHLPSQLSYNCSFGMKFIGVMESIDKGKRFDTIPLLMPSGWWCPPWKKKQ